MTAVNSPAAPAALEEQTEVSAPRPVQDTVFHIRRARFRWLAQWWRRKYVAKVNHEDVIAHVRSEGRLTSRYSFMVTMSCAIAILGLLLSSPAVVIGAMLISPLMGPIMSLGFSLCLLDIKQMKKALEGVISGVAMALAISFLIVTLSPITDATPEILARTQPNLFDLLVAIFSGLAGGYAVIKRKGETIVGVAIATALMPPLAVTGFGLATHSWPVAKGAFMLFMTNLLAISLSVTLMTRFYGFDESKKAKNHTLWQMTLVTAVFAVLSLPLGVALRDIAYQTYITKAAKAAISQYFGEQSSRISVFNIGFQPQKGATIDTVVLTQKYKSKAQDDLQAQLAQKTGRDITLSLDQVVVAHEDLVEAKPQVLADNNTIGAQVQPPAATHHAASAVDEMTAALKQAAFFPMEFIKVDSENKRAQLYPRLDRGIRLSTLHQFEDTLQKRYPEWIVSVVPPAQALPAVYFDSGAVTPTGAEKEKLDDIIWALQRWNAPPVTVQGYASSVGASAINAALASRRAQSVTGLIEKAGLPATAQTEYHGYRQRQAEKENGINSFQRVEIHLTTPLESSYRDTAAALPVPAVPEKPGAVTKEAVVQTTQPPVVAAVPSVTPDVALAPAAVAVAQNSAVPPLPKKPPQTRTETVKPRAIAEKQREPDAATKSQNPPVFNQ